MIIEADLDGAELRVICALSGEKLWKHQETCEMMFGAMPPDGKASDEYKFAKSATFRWLYTHPDKAVTGDPGQLRAGRVGVTPDTLSRFSAMMGERRQNITAWKRQQLAVLRSRKRVYNAWGRYRDLRWALLTGDPKLLQHAENVALNYPVQTAIGEHMDTVFVRAWDRIDHEVHGLTPGDVLQFWRTPRRASDAWLWGQVHDSLDGYAAQQAKADQIMQILREEIERPIPELGGLVIPADVHAGPNWRAVK